MERRTARMDANHFLGEPRLLIDLDALRTNLRTLRRYVAPEVKLCAVLKANAYGHGAQTVAQAVLAVEARAPFARVDQFAVATFDEALELHDFAKPIMLLRPVENAFVGRQRELIEHAIRSGWTMTLASAAAADDVARIALHAQKRANVQIMVDTGMSRCGVACDGFSNLLERTLHHATLRLTAVATHFANSECHGDPYTADQLRQFNRTLDTYPILESIPKHASNSGAIFFTPRAHFDMVRPGLSLYGVDPTGRPSTDRPLVPIGKLVAPIIAIHDLQIGDSVGYGQSFVAVEPTRVGILAIGYADGYPRSASNRGIVLVDGKPCGVVGRVSMDMTAINLTRCSETVVGDEVTLIDANPLSPASIYPLTRATDMIAYEVFTGLGSRVKRVLVGETITAEADADPASTES
jgi:alanine racemase